MASSIAVTTMPRAIDFSRATASAICSSSSLLALTAMILLSLSVGALPVFAVRAPVLFRAAGPSCRAVRCVVVRGVAALGLLAAPERLGDQLVGEHELG